MIITVDGQSSTGKSSLAAALARRLGANFLGSGALYRLVAYNTIKHGAFDHDEIIQKLASGLSFEYIDGEMRAVVDGIDMSAEINTPEVAKQASDIAKDPAIRNALMPLQHRFDCALGVVAEGRDMGTVIFPNAKVKFFLTADIRLRATRRHEQLRAMGIHKSINSLIDELSNRDAQDQSRAEAPLVPADEAIIIDTGIPWDESLNALYIASVEQLSLVGFDQGLRKEFDDIQEQAFKIRQCELVNGGGSAVSWWRERKHNIINKYGDSPINNVAWLCPFYDRYFDPEVTTTDDYVEDSGVNKHFYNQLMRIPLSYKPTPYRILQVAFNAGQARANGDIDNLVSLEAYLYSI